jgi:hypothetical protein
MELFGTKFCVTLGAWKLRFVLMLEDEQQQTLAAPARLPHHLTATRHHTTHAN